MANEHPTLFILRVLEGIGWELIMWIETNFWPLFDFKVLGLDYWKPEINKSWKSPPNTSIQADIFPSQQKWMGIPFDKLDSMLGSGAQDQQIKKTNTYGKYITKNPNKTSMSQILQIMKWKQNQHSLDS